MEVFAEFIFALIYFSYLAGICIATHFVIMENL